MAKLIQMIINACHFTRSQRVVSIIWEENPCVFEMLRVIRSAIAWVGRPKSRLLSIPDPNLSQLSRGNIETFSFRVWEFSRGVNGHSDPVFRREHPHVFVRFDVHGDPKAGLRTPADLHPVSAIV